MRATSRFNDKTGEWEKVEKAPLRPRVFIIGDASEPFKSMADGKIYDSKSKYRAELKARGFEELGNDRPDTTPVESVGIAEDLQKAFSEHGA